ncbi:MAG: mechanosensitive ion channel family protein [Bryobacteraceae bacterium]
MNWSLVGIVALVMGLLPLAFAGAAPTPPAAPLREADIVAHLARTISWYRRVTAAEQAAQSPADVLARDSVQRASTRALQMAFDFARAATPLVTAEPPAAGKELPAGFRVEQSSARAVERVTAIEGRIAEVEAAINKAGAQTRATLQARRKELQAELSFAKQIKESVQGIRTFLSGQATGGGLPTYIDKLERSVPEAMRGVQPPAAVTQAPGVAASGPVFDPESAGVFGLITEAIQLASRKSQLGEALAETNTLRKDLEAIRTPLVNDLRSAIRRAESASSDSASQDARQIDADRQEIEALAARFKRVSGAMAPLREQGLLIESARVSLIEQRNAVQQRYSTTLSYLLFRVLALIVAILGVLAISELWRRGTFRYVRDPRRRKQFLLLRRVVVGALIVAAIVMGVVNEMGSLATYAGFLTAGLAVALQNVIVSVIAYFFLIGRYGLRVGDRVTISGVTGDVLEIGMVRFYLMEMTGGGADLQATGRVVGFSNSVLFQPAALFRQMPGTDYVWHTAALTLAADTDLQLAERHLMAAVEAVYEPYRERIEQQHAAFQRLVDLPVSQPAPEGRLRFTNAGLEFTVRYPAEMRRAAAIDDQVVNALSEAIAREPRLTLAASGEPKVQTA